MTSEPDQGDTMAAIRYTIEPSSPLSSAPPSPPRKRSVTPTPNDSLPDTEATKKMSNLGLDGNGDPPPKKRTKLTPAEKAEKEREKEEKKREKEEKEREKARIKAEKEEQKKLKDEEKAKKDLEKAVEKAKRDEEKAKRDEEKAKKEVEKAKKGEEKVKKEEEKLKKERAQLRMDSFFTRKAPAPSPASIAPAPIVVPTKADDGIRRQPIPSQIPLAQALIATNPDIEMLDGPTNRETKTDYTKAFQPFFVRAGVTVAPSNGFWFKELPIQNSCQRMDTFLFNAIAGSSDEMEIEGQENGQENGASVVRYDKTRVSENLSPSSFEGLSFFSESKVKRGNIPKLSTKHILARLNSSPGPVPDIFGKRKSDDTDYVAELKKLPRKILKYAEDVRPAYQGTYTRVPTTSGLRKGRNPFQKSLPGVQYDYDSEAEWVQEPDDDGEDIVSEEDEDPMEVGSADEMDDFLDDEDEVVKKKNTVAGPLIPAASGLMWDGECPKSEELVSFKMGILIEGGATPINPFSQEYWIKDKRKLVPQSRAAQLAPGSEEKGKSKVQGGNWWNAHSSSSATPSASSSASRPATVVSQGELPSQGPDGQTALRYGQNLPPPRNNIYGNYNRSSSATHFSNGNPYSSLVSDSAAKAKISQVEVNGYILPLSSLADSKTAFELGIPPDQQYGYFMLYHNLDYCGMTSYTNLEKCHDFIVGNDATKIAMLEALKKMFNECTKPMLKNFMDTYCNRIGQSSGKQWKCVFYKDENSYWTLDPEVCKDIAPTVSQAGPSQQS
ncbi:chromatin assembly factor-I (CAF-I) p90 subunit [Arthrobotrys megalospora]